MTKNEIEQAIKNGESVWVANKYCIPYEVNLTNNHYIDIADNKESLMLAHIDDVELIDYLEYVFETKEKAQHYYFHANIKRTEELPFLTWEEFLENEKFYFYDSGRAFSKLFIDDNKIILSQTPDSGEWDVLKPMKSWDLTEKNLYKAYDECVKLFKGE